MGKCSLKGIDIIFFRQVKHDDGLYISRTQKVISEIFLTRLLTTKVGNHENHKLVKRTLPIYYQYPLANVTGGPEYVFAIPNYISLAIYEFCIKVVSLYHVNFIITYSFSFRVPSNST